MWKTSLFQRKLEEQSGEEEGGSPRLCNRDRMAAWSSGVSCSKCRAKACSICTVIRLCRVWLGPGVSSQKFSVT